MQDSKFIISDSGTAQEEPAILGVPVIVPRDFTERPESMENNNSVLLDISDNSCYINTIEWALSSSGSSFGWLGDGTTSRKILDIIGAKI